jgi:cation:H+ antiporter
VLIVAANLLISSSTALARRFNVSEFVIGLTVIALGTTAPELVVNIYASIEGASGIVIGNILGSCTFNILVILGLSAALQPLRVTKVEAHRDIPLVLLAGIIVGIIANDALLDQSAVSVISRTDGLIMLIFLVLIVMSILRTSRESVIAGQVPVVGKESTARVTGMLFLGFAGLYFGARWVVDGAEALARLAGISELTIGLTVVAIGTGLPELTTAIVAAYRRKSSIAIGNIVGANVLNLLLILALSALIRPVPFGVHSGIDLLVMIAASAILLGFVLSGKGKYELNRRHGIIFIMSYISYLIYLVLTAG